MFSAVTQGLVLRLESLNGVIIQNGIVVGWTDQSLSDNSLNQVVGNPVFTPNLTPTGQGAIVFDGGSDGSDDALSRLNNFSDLPTGDGDRTMFVVIRYPPVSA